MMTGGILTMKTTIDNAEMCSLEDLENVSGGTEMKVSKLCPKKCGTNLIKKYVVFPFHGYKYYCPVCNKYFKID